jgi:hypothetical protein
MSAADWTVPVDDWDGPGSVEQRVGAAELALRAVGMALGQWYGNGEYVCLSWSTRRAAAGRALAELDAAARRLAGAREALVRDIQAVTDERLAADQRRCSARWGVCPEHGNTLSCSGGRSWCRWAGCGRTWPGSRVSQHCDEPAAVVIADQAGAQMRLCAGHWAEARKRLIGARVVRVLPVAGDGAR